MTAVTLLPLILAATTTTSTPAITTLPSVTLAHMIEQAEARGRRECGHNRDAPERLIAIVVSETEQHVPWVAGPWFERRAKTGRKTPGDLGLVPPGRGAWVFEGAIRQGRPDGIWRTLTRLEIWALANGQSPFGEGLEVRR